MNNGAIFTTVVTPTTEQRKRAWEARREQWLADRATSGECRQFEPVPMPVLPPIRRASATPEPRTRRGSSSAE